MHDVFLETLQLDMVGDLIAGGVVLLAIAFLAGSIWWLRSRRAMRLQCAALETLKGAQLYLQRGKASRDRWDAIAILHRASLAVLKDVA